MSLQVPALEQELLLALLPKDEADERGVVLEVGQASVTLHRLCSPSGRGSAPSGRMRQGPAQRPSYCQGCSQSSLGLSAATVWVLCCIQRRSTMVRLHHNHNQEILSAPLPHWTCMDATLDVRDACIVYCTPQP